MTKLFKFYYDLMSQPSRVLWITFKMDKVPYEDHQIALRKREQLTKEYAKINRFQKVPCIVDGDLHLSESVAILRYLSSKGLISSTTYPHNILERTRVDEFLEWYQLGLRAPCGMYFMESWLLPMNGLAAPPSVERKEKLLKQMENSLKDIESWLNNGSFLVNNKMTIADLFAACEIEQTKLLQYDPSKKFPKVAEWLNKLRELNNPYYDEAHKYIYKKSGVDVKV